LAPSTTAKSRRTLKLRNSVAPYFQWEARFSASLRNYRRNLSQRTTCEPMMRALR